MATVKRNSRGTTKRDITSPDDLRDRVGGTRTTRTGLGTRSSGRIDKKIKTGKRTVFLHGSSNPNLKIGDTLSTPRLRQNGSSATRSSKVAKQYATSRDILKKGQPTIYKVKPLKNASVTKRVDSAGKKIKEYNSKDFVIVGKKKVTLTPKQMKDARVASRKVM